MALAGEAAAPGAGGEPRVERQHVPGVAAVEVGAQAVGQLLQRRQRPVIALAQAHELLTKLGEQVLGPRGGRAVGLRLLPRDRGQQRGDEDPQRRQQREAVAQRPGTRARYASRSGLVGSVRAKARASLG